MLVIILLVVILLTAVGVTAWLLLVPDRGAVRAEEKLVEPLADLKALRSSAERAAMEEAELVRLREEVAAAQARAQEQERLAAEIITELRGQCDSLRQNVMELESAAAVTPAVPRDDERVDHLRAENAAFRVQLDETASEMRQLKELAARLEQENQGFKATGEPVAEAQKLVDAARQEYQRQMEGLYKEIEDLRAENLNLKDMSAAGEKVPDLRREIDALSGTVREMEIAGASLSEKNAYLQYELTKSRAQVVGLERLCENMKAEPVSGAAAAASY